MTSRITIKEAIAVVFNRRRPLRGQARMPTLFQSAHYRGRHLVRRAPARCNLRTNAGIDWQAGIMGDYTTDAGTATGSGATSLTDTGKSWTTNAWAGQCVVALVDVNTIRYGVILSNTATVQTIDRWYDPTNPGGAAGSTPATTSKYAILPGGFPHWWMALSTTVQSGAAGDTVLAGEITDSGLLRSLPTSYTHSAGVNTYSIAKTYTATGTKTINSEAVFNAQNAGLMPFESAEPNPPTLVSGDTLAQTVTVTI